MDGLLVIEPQRSDSRQPNLTIFDLCIAESVHQESYYVKMDLLAC
jgi:hypothetical protein